MGIAERNAQMSCDRCGNDTRPLAEDNGEMLCDGYLDPEDELPLLYDAGYDTSPRQRKYLAPGDTRDAGPTPVAG